jgi:hypothetical protein
MGQELERDFTGNEAEECYQAQTKTACEGEET